MPLSCKKHKHKYVHCLTIKDPGCGSKSKILRGSGSETLSLGQGYANQLTTLLQRR
jgi:hypothetical protein